jgi:hypothetical protein
MANEQKRLTLQQYLRLKGACTAGRQAVGRQHLHTAWRRCENMDWMMWFLDRERVKGTQCDCESRLSGICARTQFEERAVRAGGGAAGIRKALGKEPHWDGYKVRWVRVKARG